MDFLGAFYDDESTRKEEGGIACRPPVRRRSRSMYNLSSSDSASYVESSKCTLSSSDSASYGESSMQSVRRRRGRTGGLLVPSRSSMDSDAAPDGPYEIQCPRDTVSRALVELDSTRIDDRTLRPAGRAPRTGGCRRVSKGGLNPFARVPSSKSIKPECSVATDFIYEPIADRGSDNCSDRAPSSNGQTELVDSVENDVWLPVPTSPTSDYDSVYSMRSRSMGKLWFARGSRNERASSQ